jgi:hypothetical protein
MKYPVVITLPFLMLTDYYLTLLSKVLKDKKLSKFIILEEWELNPIYQVAINQKRLINIKHLFFTIFLSSLVIYLTEFCNLPQEFIDFLLGMLIIMYSIIIGGHISNILWCCYVIKREDQLSGQIHYTYEATLYSSMPKYLLPVFPLIVIYIYTGNLFVLGGVCGVIVQMISLLRFNKMMKRRKKLIKKDSTKTPSESIK